MNYQLKATGKTPALVVFLLDVSASMSLPLEGKPRIAVVTDALRSIVSKMVHLSTRGAIISPRYHVAMYAYSDQPYSLLDSIKSIEQIANLGVPRLQPKATTNTAMAFEAVEEFLKSRLHNYEHCPAPLVCHLTDGENTGEADPEPVARRIMQMSVADGPVLVENIFMSDTILDQPVTDIHAWPGILPTTPLISDYARKLRNMSSTLPEEYRIMMEEMKYQIAPNAVMLLPGTSLDLISMGFVMATMTRA